MNRDEGVRGRRETTFFKKFFSFPPRHDGYWSLELHPWKLPAEITPEWVELAKEADAVGEIGLDRLRGPELKVQLEFFEAALRVADEAGKPVVIHCVRAIPELLTALKPYPKMRKMFHGFDGKPEALRELIRHGFVVSLGAKALRREDLREVLAEPEIWAHLGIESDDGGDLAANYRRAKELAGWDIEPQLRKNFFQFLGRTE